VPGVFRNIDLVDGVHQNPPPKFFVAAGWKTGRNKELLLEDVGLSNVHEANGLAVLLVIDANLIAGIPGRIGQCEILIREAVRETAGARPVFCGSVDYHQSGHAPVGPEGDPYGIVYLEDIENRGLEAMIDGLVMQHHRHLFFTKHLDWRDECEFRWVVRSKDRQPLFVPITHALRGILIGQDCCSDEHQDKLLALCRSAGVPIHRVYWHGWAMSVFGDPREDEVSDPLSLNGISFSTKIPCNSVFTHGLGHDGRVRTVEIRSSGEVVPRD
jgi:hypothetical protein